MKKLRENTINVYFYTLLLTVRHTVSKPFMIMIQNGLEDYLYDSVDSLVTVLGTFLTSVLKSGPIKLMLSERLYRTVTEFLLQSIQVQSPYY